MYPVGHCGQSSSEYMCLDMCVEIWMDMCMDMRIDLYTHLVGHRRSHLRAQQLQESRRMPADMHLDVYRQQCTQVNRHVYSMCIDLYAGRSACVYTRACAPVTGVDVHVAPQLADLANVTCTGSFEDLCVCACAGACAPACRRAGKFVLHGNLHGHVH